MILRLLVLLAALAGVVAPAGAQTSAPVLSGEGSPIIPIATEADYARVVGQALSRYITPAYQRLADASKALESAVGGFCATPASATRDAVAPAFSEALVAWAGVDFFRFGPMAQAGRYERFAYWPDVHGTGARQLRQFLASKDDGLLAPGALARQSAAVQGLPALESLLYSGSAALLQDKPLEAFRCALAVAVAGNLAAIADEARSSWTGGEGWAALIAGPGPENPVYRTHAEAMTELIKAIVTGLEQDRDHRLLPPLGTTPEDAKSSRAPYARSGFSLAYIAAGAASLQHFVEASGILDILPADQKGYANSALFEFARLRDALTEAGPDLEAALAQRAKRSKLVYATIVLQSLRDTFQRHIAVAAGLTPGFNSLDGD